MSSKAPSRPFVVPSGPLKSNPSCLAAVEVAAYRIAMEALTNVLRHADATSCSMLLEVDGELRPTVRDEGVGLPLAYTARVGLRSIRERAGELGGTVTLQQLNSDTQASVTLPLAR